MSDLPTQWTVVASATAATATATKAAVAGHTHYITGVTISPSATATAAASALVRSGTTPLDHVNTPAAAFAPIVLEYGHPIRCVPGESANVTIGTLGAAVTCTVTIRGFTRVQS